jgi:GntR family transcriptional regulator/MocR family aminotransferase
MASLPPEAVTGKCHLIRHRYDQYRSAVRSAPALVAPAVGIDRSSEIPLYRQLYEGYRDAIVDRRLRPGQRIPSTRSLAVELEISRIAVLSAFEQLLAEGYFEARAGSGTFVARSLPDDLLKPRRAPSLPAGRGARSAGSPPSGQATRPATRRAAS